MKNFLKKISDDSAGFTMLEIIVSMFLFVTIIVLISSMFTLSQRSYNAGSNGSELSQNARVAVDRLSREIRQSPGIQTILSTTTPSDEIFFQDGHNNSQITYIKYYLNGSNLMRSHLGYSYDSAPTDYVIWNSTNLLDESPIKRTLEDNIIGEYFTAIQFTGNSESVDIAFNLLKKEKSLQINSKVSIRN